MKTTDSLECLPKIEEEGYRYGKAWAYYVLVLFFLLCASNFLVRRVIIPLFPAIKAALKLSDTQLGFLGGAVNLTIPIFVFPVAYLIDKYGRKNIIGVMSAVWTACSMLGSIVTGFWPLFFTRLGLGIGEAGFAPGSNAVIADYFPKSKRSTAMGIMNAGSSFGVVLGLLLGGMISAKWGWEKALLLVAIPGIALTILTFFIKEKPLALPANATANQLPMGKFLKKMFTTPTLLLIYAGTALFVLFVASVNTWNTTLFVRVHQIPIQKAALYAAGILVISGISGLYGGALVDFVRKRIKTAPMIITAITMLWSGIFYTVGFFVAPQSQQITFIIIATITISCFSGPIYAALLELSPAQAKAKATSLIIIIQNILGLALGPILTGFLSDKFGLEHAIGIMGIIGIIAALLILAGTFTFLKDLERSECL